MMQTAAKAVNELQGGQGANKVMRKDLVLDSLEQKGMATTPSGKSRKL
jgi:hypothetical protein